MKVTADTITDAQIRQLRDETGGVHVAGKESCALALGESIDTNGDDAYYASLADQALAREHCATEWNARHGGRP